MTGLSDFFDKLCSVELDRATAAEICIDELLTIMDRHGERGSMYSTLCSLSRELNSQIRDADGMDGRFERLTRIRKSLTNAFPMTDEDLAAARSPQEGGGLGHD